MMQIPGDRLKQAQATRTSEKGQKKSRKRLREEFEAMTENRRTVLAMYGCFAFCRYREPFDCPGGAGPDRSGKVGIRRMQLPSYSGLLGWSRRYVG